MFGRVIGDVWVIVFFGVVEGVRRKWFFECKVNWVLLFFEYDIVYIKEFK